MAQASTALITGASTGIGRATALALAGRGWRVFASVRREADARALTEATPNGAIPIHPLHFDVLDAEAMQSAATELATSLDGEALTALINNAGIAIAGPLAYLPLDAFRRQMAINVEGLLATTQAFLPLMERGGRVVNISSIAGRLAFPMMGAYHASKHAVEGLSDCLRLELARQGIEVVVIQPGPVKTAIWDTAGRAAAEIQAQLPPAAERDYGRLMQQVAKATARAEAEGVSAEACAEVICRALSARRPRTRYVVGGGPRKMIFLRRWLLSDRLYDRLILRSLKV